MTAEVLLVAAGLKPQPTSVTAIAKIIIEGLYHSDIESPDIVLLTLSNYFVFSEVRGKETLVCHRGVLVVDLPLGGKGNKAGYRGRGRAQTTCRHGCHSARVVYQKRRESRVDRKKNYIRKLVHGAQEPQCGPTRSGKQSPFVAVAAPYVAGGRQEGNEHQEY